MPLPCPRSRETARKAHSRSDPREPIKLDEATTQRQRLRKVTAGQGDQGKQTQGHSLDHASGQLRGVGNSRQPTALRVNLESRSRSKNSPTPPQRPLCGRGASDREAHARRLPGDAALFRDRFGGDNNTARDEALPALVLAREHENRVVFGDSRDTAGCCFRPVC
jgi:hypothetical protein